MTSSDTSTPQLRPPDDPVRIRMPGGLLAAIPALMGFHPDESLVLIATGGESGRRLGLTVRIDLPPPEHVDAVAESVVRSLLRDNPAGAAVIVVGACPGDGGADPPQRELVDLVIDGLEEHGIDVHTVLWAEGTRGGARWGCFEACACGGVVPDAASTPMMATAVAGGLVMYADRDELRRSVLPVADGRLRRREQQLIEADDRAADIDAASPDSAAARLALVDAALTDVAAGRLELDDERVVALAMALLDPAVRDAALVRCTGATAGAAEQLWAALTRETPDPEAAEPAALLAVSALLRGDGALANVALDRAQQAWPGHSLTGLLRTVADAGMRPTEFRDLLLEGLAGAAGGRAPQATSEPRRPSGRRARRR